MGERRDLERIKVAIPFIDAAPTMIVIAISIAEKCPLKI
jgi:hypothetical protein